MTFASGFERFRGQTVLLVGAGARAAATLRRLTAAGAHVHWFSPDADAAEEIALSRRPDRIEVALRDPDLGDVGQAAAVIAAVGEPLARRISEQARALGRPVAVLGRPDLSTFDIDERDDGGSGDVTPSRLGASLRHAGERLSARLSRAMKLLATALAASSSV